MNKKIKTKRKKLILLLIVILVGIIILPTFSRYIYNNVRENYLNSKQFYFTSNLLTINNSKISLSNWGGSSDYILELNINSKLNELTKVDYDINYELTCIIEEKDKATLFLDSESGLSTEGKEDGTIKTTRNVLKEGNTDTIKLYIKPKERFSMGQSINLKIKAVTTEPYKKEISATISVIVGLNETDYTIEDSVNSEYAMLKLVNSKKDESILKIAYDPTKVRIDLTDDFFDLDNLVTELTDSSLKQWTRTLDSTQKYIKEVKFYLKGQSSKNIRFYKIDRTIDYTYPNTNGKESVLKITTEK